MKAYLWRSNNGGLGMESLLTSERNKKNDLKARTLNLHLIDLESKHKPIWHIRNSIQ